MTFFAWALIVLLVFVVIGNIVGFIMLKVNAKRKSRSKSK